jgi:hypothetical protein
MTWADLVWRTLVPLVLFLLGLYGLTAEQKGKAVRPKLKFGLVEIPILQLAKPWHSISNIAGIVLLVIGLLWLMFKWGGKAEPPLGVNLISLTYESGSWNPRLVDFRNASSTGIEVGRNDSLRLRDLWIYAPEDARGFDVKAVIYANDKRIGETALHLMTPGAMMLGDIEITGYQHGKYVDAWLSQEGWESITVALEFYKDADLVGETSTVIRLTDGGNAWIKAAPYASLSSVVYSVNAGPLLVLDTRNVSDQGIRLAQNDTLTLHEIWYKALNDDDQNTLKVEVYLSSGEYDSNTSIQSSAAIFDTGVHQLALDKPFTWVIPVDKKQLIMTLTRNDGTILDRFEIPFGQDDTGLVPFKDAVLWPFDFVPYMDFESAAEQNPWKAKGTVTLSLSPEHAFSGKSSLAVTLKENAIDDVILEYNQPGGSDLFMGYIYWPDQDGVKIEWAQLCAWACVKIPMKTGQWNRFDMPTQYLTFDHKPLGARDTFWIQAIISGIGPDTPYTFFIDGVQVHPANAP